MDWVKLVLRGVGQVMFQGHAATGLLILLGIAWADWLMGLGALIGAMIGPVVARLMKYDAAQIRDGIYGFNSTLVGIAAFFFFQPGVVTVILLVLACAASTPVTMVMRRYLPFSTYTLPFIVTTWVMFGIGKAMGLPVVEHPPGPESLDLVRAFSEGLSEVFLQASIVCGIAIFIGLAISDPRHAVLAFVGSMVGTLVAIYHGAPVDKISLGLYGYNASLAAIALYLWRPSLVIALLGAILSTPITECFPMTGLPTLTAPFVVACWIVLALGALEPYFHRFAPAAHTPPPEDIPPAPA